MHRASLLYRPLSLVFGLAALLGCKKDIDPRFVEVKAERDVGLLKTITEGDTEYALLQLNQYSSLYGVKDFWISSRAKEGEWSEPLFTGAVYQFAPPKLRYIPSKVLDFHKEEDFFVLVIGVPPEKAKNYEDVPTYTYRVSLAEMRQDSDKDGLTDVTEKLWMLDPQNPDTDQDGTKDKEDKDPLTAPRDNLTDEEQLQRIAYARYHCDRGEPVIFQGGVSGLFPIPDTGCVNLMLSKEQIEAYLAPDANGNPRYDRSFDVIRFAAKIEGSQARVKLGNTVGFQLWLFERDKDGWEFSKILQEPEIYKE